MGGKEHFEPKALERTLPDMKLQLSLGQHWFKLLWFTYMQIFFFNKYVASPLSPQVLHLQIQPTMVNNVFPIHDLESRQLYALLYAILYKGLGPP